MRIEPHTYLQLSLLLFFLLFSQMAKGIETSYSTPLRGVDIQQNEKITVQDAWYTYMKNNLRRWQNRSAYEALNTPYNRTVDFTNLAINGFVSLRWQATADVAFTSDWFYKIEVEIQAYDAFGRGMPLVTRILTIDYGVARQENFKDWDIFQIPNADKMEVKVISIERSTDGVNYSTVTQVTEVDIYLEAEVVVERIHNINVNVAPTLQKGTPNADGTIPFTWTALVGAEEYDFEWLFVSDAVTPSTIDWDNASRVSLTNNTYNLEFPYESGVVYFRVRGVGYGNELNSHINTTWSTNNPVHTINTGIENNKNWTYSVNYAEQGKRAESLTIADGTGRGRQSITKDNTNNRAIVAETVFDREGRQSIQVIPSVAPSNQNQLNFHQNYNLNSNTNNPIHWTDFDQVTPPAALTLANTAGASQYFSDQNPDIGTSLADFIPDAKNKPYTQTVFDNQGRVAQQSGVGSVHSIGSGHETKYFYAAAFQEDLDELFGSEIGYAEHYAMQMTTDPNGQNSISFTNLSGKTVATALVGIAPRENGEALVEELDGTVYRYNTTGRQKTRNFVPHNELEKEEHTASWVVEKEFMVMSEGDHDFTYAPEIGQYATCFPTDQDTCEFELRINIYDKQGNNVNSTHLSNITLLTADLSAPIPTPATLGTYFTVIPGDRLTFRFNANTGDVGSYTMVKELRLKDVRPKVEDYNSNLLDYQEDYLAYIAQYYEDFQYNLVHANDSGFVARNMPTEPTHPYENCINFEVRAAGDWLNPCLVQVDSNINNIPQNYCSITKNTLKHDLLPGGQYFDNRPDPTNPNAWLDIHIDLLQLGGATYNGTTYYDWSTIKTLSTSEIEDLMEINNLFENHPEWCLYEAKCLEDGQLTNQNSWYEDMLQQNAEWSTMDYTDALGANYFSSSSPILPTPFCSGTSAPNGSANISYALIDDVLDRLPLSFGSGSTYETTLRELLCNYSTDNSGGSPVYYSVVDLATSGSPTNEEIWERLRAMMIDAKEQALDAYINDPNNSCDYLEDDDPTDNQLTTAAGFVINIPSYTESKDQLHQNSGVSMNVGASGSAIDDDILNTYTNTIGQQYTGSCDYYEVTFNYDCQTVSNGTITDFILDYSSSPFLQSFYGPGTNSTANTIVIFKIDQNIMIPICNDSDFADQLQQYITDQIVNNLTPPLNADLKVEVIDNPTGGVDIILQLPGTTYSSTGVSNGYANINPYSQSSSTNAIADSAFTYHPCTQNYTTCICEDIKALETYFTANGIATADVYTNIALKYNHDFGLLSGDTINENHVKYILEGYCGTVTSAPHPNFPNFVVPPSTAPAQHLPLNYPIVGFEDYEDWKTVFVADDNIPIAFHDRIKQCLDINPGISCEQEALDLAIFHASERMKEQVEEATAAFKQLLLTQCMEKPIEDFYMEYIDHTLHHTLYYYDASGNLEKTVPPTGVTLLATAQELQDAATERNNNTGIPIEPNHQLSTYYAYNTLNNVVHSTAPDRGTVSTYYDELGRAVLTQNAQQQLDGEASYVVYDALGRITETGVTQEDANYTFTAYQASTAFQTDLNEGNFPAIVVANHNWTKKEVRTTLYNTAAMDNLFELPNNLLRNRVGTQSYAMDGENLDYQVAYNYDVFGNAQEVWQYYPHLLGNEYKQLKYNYDLIAGVVHQVDYQEGERDHLSFRYTYDANNRLTKAQSSINGFIWNTEASYEYYLHGPLKRVEIGESKVQGLDYVYTMHGWIKGVNSNQLQANLDPGKDGENASGTYTALHDRVAKDVFGYGVHYYDGDYLSINSAVQNFSTNPTGTGNLYNGNISSVTQAQTKPALGGGVQQALPSIWKKYRYDLLHRIVQAQTAETTVGTTWGSPNWAGTTAYQTNYSYGPNGNILNLTRYGAASTSPLLIDQLSYNYTGSTTTTTDPKQFTNNQLLGIVDAAGSHAGYTDIETQPNIGSGLTQQNYLYDENGSLIQDLSEEIAIITWTAEKKLASLERANGSTRDNLKYIYDFQGNRISKVAIPQDGNQKERHQVYVRDPQGNTLAIYEYEKKQTGSIAGRLAPPVFLKEQLLYGSDRLGTIKRNTQTGGYVHVLGNGQQTVSNPSLSTMVSSYLEYSDWNPSNSYEPYTADVNTGVDTNKIVPISTLSYLAKEEWQHRSTGGNWANSTVFTNNYAVIKRLERVRGKVRYELKNFRGDIRQVISDVKYREEVNGVVEYTADVWQVEDSYPFGWSIKDRSFTHPNPDEAYRFGFNGKENDPDFGNQLIQDYGFRLYNPAIAKFLSVDPLAPEYPWYTPYQFAGNKPIYAIDLDGLEPGPVIANPTVVAPTLELNPVGLDIPTVQNSSTSISPNSSGNPSGNTSSTLASKAGRVVAGVVSHPVVRTTYWFVKLNTNYNPNFDPAKNDDAKHILLPKIDQLHVDRTTNPEDKGSNEDRKYYVSIWKAANPNHLTSTQLLLPGSFNKVNFPGKEGEIPNGKAYFAEDKSTALEYMRKYGSQGVIEFKIEQDLFNEKIAPHRKFHDRDVLNGRDRYEYRVPPESFDVLNEAEKVHHKNEW